ncbi:MAG: S-formylglutathione hydrolase [Snodgrassella sp.]|uniref:S-formylglutathione hydrolase n=1 Tax=Snodgrassella TaxID=1193515 RepID=UPI00159F1749|nr:MULTISPECIES: S-formylglutathione hydrolase [Snodgrassella]MCO6508991.1 S-formylglutathione hydrolase [Snodgrassella sp.]MCO6514165.1 S-formylglutathione hydrolase [Snodgrassella sp.]MCO6514958.1 S-formylglutathione hydrolase [Snodgrassella sp.]MCO6520869.1 S-formylglutathione hydrolase [Snodgrassella sp.]MCO6523192.1 S-formylglutathione hydrolase [Snodgrassella sp.]
MTLLATHQLFNGEQRRYRHYSRYNQCDMTFSVYLPSRALQGYRLPVVYCLGGLTCTDENFSIKSGAQRFAAEWGIVLVMPDTSPRGTNVANADIYSLGQGAGFYVNATQQPWVQHYQMYDYVVTELPELIEKHFPVNEQRSLCGHSMGGHGALMIALKNPQRYLAVSAFAPIAHPIAGTWGQEAFTAYLGKNQADWAIYDSTELISQNPPPFPILIDQGSVDEYYPAQLHPQDFVQAARFKGVNIRYHLRKNYDHSYYFVSTFIESHISFHAEAFGL